MEILDLTMFTETVKYSGDVIFIKPFCDFFQISYENQCRVITKDPILKKSSTKKSSITQFGDEFKRYTLQKKGFIRWIQLINPQIVQVNLREKLLQYQTLVFDFLYGNIERKEEMKQKQLRLLKLRKLYSKIGNEIQLCEREIKVYLNQEFFQIEFDFPPKKAKERATLA